MKRLFSFRGLIASAPIFFAALLSLAVNLGCATNPRRQPWPPPPSEADRRNFGVVGLVCIDGLTNTIGHRPLSPGAATARGAGEGALWGLRAGAEVAKGGGPYAGIFALAVWTFTVPAGALVGGAIGSKEGLPVRERERIANQLRSAVVAAELHNCLATELVAAVDKATPGAAIRLIADPAPTNTASIPPDTILEIVIVNAGIAGSAERVAPLSAFLEARARVVRSRDQALLYEHTWVMFRGNRTFEEWAAINGTVMRNDLRQLAAPLAESIIEEVFLVYDPTKAD